ncbi:MAG: RNA methyltransferase [Lachnospiraceae bacterium]|nr:RNA methyltransferase [Lachnospiraceae bacterium]
MITSAANEKIKHLIALRDKAKVRREEGLFLVEGIRMLREIPPADLVTVFASEDFYEKNSDALPSNAEILDNKVFAKVSTVNTPQGVIAIVKQKSYSLHTLTDTPSPLLLVLETIQDPGNLGTMFRTAEAAGCSGIIMTSDCADPYSPKTVRSTMGAILRLPFVTVPQLDEVFTMLKSKNITTYAAALEASVPYTTADYTKGSALLIGNEGNGLKKDTIVKVTTSEGCTIHIPMAGKTESLNASVSAAILMYEAARQRGFNVSKK